jgi:hypothetical protein
MKKIIIFLAFFISSQSLAQNVNQNNQARANNSKTIGTPAPGSNVKTALPPMTPEEKAFLEKNIAEQNDFQNAIKNLQPAQQKKFQEINQVFGLKMIEYNKALTEEIIKISKIQNLMTITSFIFKGKLDVNPIRNSTKSQQDFYQKQITEYQKLSPDKKKLIKQEFIKFRKNINALEKKRRQEFKILFKRDFISFKERETEDEIKNDDK